MLVMHLLNNRGYSGSENVAITIINSTKKDIDSVYVSPYGFIEEYLLENSIKYFPLQSLSISEVRRAIKTLKPDIIHAHDFRAGVISSLSGTIIPIINQLHNNNPWAKHYGLFSFIYALTCARYKKIITVSESVMNEYVFGHRFKNKTVVIGNTIDIEKIQSLAGIAKISYDIAFLGRFYPQKNPCMFLDIIAEVKKFKKDISAIMIGDGILREEVTKKIQNYKLGKNITLVGFQKNPYIYLNQAKMLCIPSAWEGFGLVALEALALGKPVICANVGGLPSIVNDTCGKLCCEINEYTNEIIKLLQYDKEFHMKSINAINRAKELSDLVQYGKKMMCIYAEVQKK